MPMDSKSLIDATRAAIANAESAGVKSLSTEKIRALLNQLEVATNAQRKASSELPPAELEKYKATLAAWVADLGRIASWQLEAFKSVVLQGQATLRSAMLINGAGAVALLAFLGNLTTSDAPSLQVPPFAGALMTMVVGVVLAALA